MTGVESDICEKCYSIEKKHQQLRSRTPEPWLSRRTFREVDGIFVQKTPSQKDDVEVTPKKSNKRETGAKNVWKQNTPVREKDVGETCRLVMIVWWRS